MSAGANSPAVAAPCFELCTDHSGGEGAFLNLSKTSSQLQRLTAELPPRLSQTLAELLRGQAEKEIAAAWGLSRHTVHGYIKQIYSHFDVRSRGELLALWIERDAG